MYYAAYEKSFFHALFQVVLVVRGLGEHLEMSCLLKEAVETPMIQTMIPIHRYNVHTCIRARESFGTPFGLSIGSKQATTAQSPKC